MGQNLYEVLGLPKGTSDAAQIKKAYRKQALRFHPDKPTGDKEKFQAISEAFEVLSDPKKKQLYDQFGKAGLSAGDEPAPDMPFTRAAASGSRRPAGGSSHQTFSFSTNRGGGGGGGGGFQHSDPFSIFESMFGTGEVDKVGESEAFSGFPMGAGQGMSGMGGGFSGMAGMPRSPGTQGARRQAPPVEHILNLSLEELFQGSSKRMRITKKTASGGSQQVDKTIAIKPGWKDGTKITYKEEGDEQPGMVPSDIVFVIKTKPHSRFSRQDNNLICTIIITLEQALTGFSIPIDTLDGRTVMASEPGGIPSSSHETVIRGEGMPSQRDQRVRGNLTVRYNVEFPEPAKTEAKRVQRRQAMERL